MGIGKKRQAAFETFAQSKITFFTKQHDLLIILKKN